MSKGSLDPTLTSFVGTLVYYGVLAFAVIAALMTLLRRSGIGGEKEPKYATEQSIC
jgi:hypothetical protein